MACAAGLLENAQIAYCRHVMQTCMHTRKHTQMDRARLDRCWYCDEHVSTEGSNVKPGPLLHPDRVSKGTYQDFLEVPLFWPGWSNAEVSGAAGTCWSKPSRCEA